MNNIKMLSPILLMVVGLASANDDGMLDIAAFNIQIFGERKLKDTAVREKLLDIVQRYDLILVEEIRDHSGKAIKSFIEELNNRNKGVTYASTVSPRLGRTNSKEQYAFLYRTDWLSLKDERTYDDVDDVFEREPYCALFKSKKAAIKTFAAIGIHTKPDDAENEISHLADVHKDLVDRWGVKDVIIMGDFNGDCGYTKNWDDIKLAKQKDFYWLIDDGFDTTVKNTDCAYDRIVVSGKNLLRSIVPGSVGTYRFDSEMNQDFAEKVSDHYPVHMKIYSKESMKSVTPKHIFCASDKRIDAPGHKMATISKAINSEYMVTLLYTSAQKLASFSASHKGKGKGKLNKRLSMAQSDLLNLVTDAQITLIKFNVEEYFKKWYATGTNGVYQVYSDFYRHLTLIYDLTVTCTHLDAQAECQTCVSLHRRTGR